LGCRGWWGCCGVGGFRWGISRGFGSAGLTLGRFGQIGGEFDAVWNSEELPEWRDLNPSHSEVSLENAYEWKTKLAAWREEVPELRFAFVPYYWPVTGYVAGWAGLLIWRKRKFEKTMVE
jgi:hypothetical protein